jgi:hypothetical protein
VGLPFERKARSQELMITKIEQDDRLSGLIWGPWPCLPSVPSDGVGSLSGLNKVVPARLASPGTWTKEM